MRGGDNKKNIKEKLIIIFYLGAKICFAFAIGVLLYLMSNLSIFDFGIIFLLYLIIVIFCWNNLSSYLRKNNKISISISVFGIIIGSIIIFIRESAIYTFIERLYMIRNSFKYLFKNPLLGIGSYQWRIFNLYDSDKYFNTWHIHNSFLHIGVEYGLIAMFLLIVLSIKIFRNIQERELKALFIAFIFHNLIDTSFFYLGILLLFMISVTNNSYKLNNKKLFSENVKSKFLYFIIIVYMIVCYLRLLN